MSKQCMCRLIYKGLLIDLICNHRWPNNPDGRKLLPLQPDPKRRVYDLSFDWPTYTDIQTKINEVRITGYLPRSSGVLHLITHRR